VPGRLPFFGLLFFGFDGSGRPVVDEDDADEAEDPLL
jgi:hypothetical protein